MMQSRILSLIPAAPISTREQDFMASPKMLLCKKQRMLFWSNLELTVKCVVQDLLHVIPFGHNAMLNRPHHYRDFFEMQVINNAVGHSPGNLISCKTSHETEDG
eukprot:Gb_04654 [translate_table: standard]